VLLVICTLYLQPTSAKRGKKGKSKKHRVQGPAAAPVLSAEQRAAQDQRVQQGVQLAATGRLADAEKAFGAALRVEPTNYAALGNRALLLPQMGRAAEGVAALEHAALLYPSDSSIPYNLGTLQSSLGQDTDAVSQFLSAHKLASTGARIRRLSYSIARAHDMHDRLLLTELMIVCACMGYGFGSSGHEVKMHAANSAGASLFKLNRPAEALHFFDEAMVAQKRTATIDLKTMQQTTLNRAAALVKLGRSSESLETYTRAIEAAPLDVVSRLSRANAWKEIGGLEGDLQSATDFISALELMAEQGIEEVYTPRANNVETSMTNVLFPPNPV
jgi:tetratricopeptide (TPR) repeat protein